MPARKELEDGVMAAVSCYGDSQMAFFHVCEKSKLDLSSLLSGSYSVGNLASWDSSTNAASRFIFLQSTSKDAASRGKWHRKGQ